MNQPTQQPQSYGYLIVRVSTARGAIPLSGAAVNIRGGSDTEGGILHSLVTDADGRTNRVALPTPQKSASQTPDNGIPYAMYRVDVFRDGYIPISFENVPVFPSVLSVQPAVLVPENGSGSIHSPGTVVESETLSE